MSKAALNAGLKSLSVDLKKDRKSVLILHPGYVRTDMTGNNGELETSESVPGLLKLMNEKSLTETGSFWHTNGQNLSW
jgi:NAD(P)-dependent dehydrogenase (short-subunit alcohol dehydrogenase family)